MLRTGAEMQIFLRPINQTSNASTKCLQNSSIQNLIQIRVKSSGSWYVMYGSAFMHIFFTSSPKIISLTKFYFLKLLDKLSYPVLRFNVTNGRKSKFIHSLDT
jgi:hypothetical protein